MVPTRYGHQAESVVTKPSLQACSCCYQAPGNSDDFVEFGSSKKYSVTSQGAPRQQCRNSRGRDLAHTRRHISRAVSPFCPRASRLENLYSPILTGRMPSSVDLKWHYTSRQCYRVKPHGQLVLVSLTCHHASTPSLSTSWSRTTLQRDQVPREISSSGKFPA